jgi:tRNA modification GTPase
MDTIFALSSAHGRAGVAVVRISGARAKAALEALSGKPAPMPRQAALRRLKSGNGEALDDAIVLYFKGPESFSGEDIVELHLHGGPAIVGGVLAALVALEGLRPAAPGEFTRRAVENGKLDLTRAEAIADLVNAETQSQRKQALRQYEGVLAELYERWREQLIRATALSEAAIDFSEEELPETVAEEADETVRQVLANIRSHLADARRGELTRDGLYLTVIGPPNSGKSSMINQLAQRDVAIVSEAAGTTRDVIEVRLDLGGYAVTVADTAGLREAAEAVEAEGVRRALARAESADLVLLLLDGSSPNPLAGMPKDIRTDFTVWNKSDLHWPALRQGLRISTKSGEGLSDLIDAISQRVREKLENRSDSPLLTRARHRHALEHAAVSLEHALAENQAELKAENLRLALRELGRITGRVDVEDLLDVIFRDFCIGK